MQRINIYEKDNTSNNISTKPQIGSVFIPGFAVGGTFSAYTPSECTSVMEFTQKFGSEAPTFSSQGNNNYPCCVAPTVSESCIVDTYNAATGSKTSLVEKFGIYIDESNPGAEAWDNTKSYSANDLVIHGDENGILSVYKANGSISANTEWDFDDWTIVIKSSELIKVLSDETRQDESEVGPETYYQYQINASSMAGYAVFIAQAPFSGFPTNAIPYTPGEQDPSTIPMYFAGQADPSWSMAIQLLELGMPVTYYRMNNTADEVTVEHAYDVLANKVFKYAETNELLDKGCNVQFITSGGYPVLEYTNGSDSAYISNQMISLAQDTQSYDVRGRGDCVALLDHTDNAERVLTGENSVFENQAAIPNSSFAAVFTPWCNVNASRLSVAPASFVYLCDVAQNIGKCSTWSIYAGVTLGRSTIVTSLRTNATLTNRIAEIYQADFDTPIASNKASLNAITYIRNYGYCIWGNRTCKRYVTGGKDGFALSFLNVRNLVSEVKKSIYETAQAQMFEINDEVLWTKFKARTSILLDRMVSGYGLEGYKFNRQISPDKTKLDVQVILYPTYGLESIQVTISLEDNNNAASTSEQTA